MGVRLSGEASPTKEAKDDQHNNDNDDDPKNRHVILSVRSVPTLFPVGSSLQRERAYVGVIGERFSGSSSCLPGVLGRGDKRNAQSENDSGDSEPYRSPKTKLRGARRRFATASPNEEEPLGAALNPPSRWCPNDAKCRPRQREATGDEERSDGYHTSKLPGGFATSASTWARLYSAEL